MAEILINTSAVVTELNLGPLGCVVAKLIYLHLVAKEEGTVLLQSQERRKGSSCS